MRMKKICVDDLKDVTVYPKFCKYSRTFHLHKDLALCENDRGEIAFLSQEVKEDYLRRKNMNG